MLDLLKAAILGIVEGITEWLPISSTGHLILVDEFISLGMSDAFKEMFDVVIQFGAILAVVVLFWGKLWPFCNRRAVRHNGEGAGHYLVRRYCRQDVWLMWFKVLVAVLPAMLILYGVLFIVVESSPRRVKMATVESLSWATAFGIGLFQVLSLVPGTSRSGATILGGILLGCSRTLAAEFTFFLAIPVMAGASLIKLLKFGFSFSAAELAVLGVGMLTAFVVSMLSIRFLMNYVKRHDFKVFGWYRIVLGAIVLAYFFLLKPMLG